MGDGDPRLTDSAQTESALTESVLKAGRDAGLSAVGVTGADVLEPAATVLRIRKAKGLSGSMNFTYRNPARSTDPSRVLPAAQSIVAGALSYRRAPLDQPDELVGRVARYAWRDHYGDLRVALESMAAVLEADGWAARVHLDDNNLVDRNVAYRAGLGWYGKNANLLLPGEGSWFVLGSIVTDAPLVRAPNPQPDGCGPCRRCLDDCPTGAIVAPGVVDARRCLAWLVQGPGAIPVEFRQPLGDRLYGCDDCQDVCPPNRRLDNPPADAEPDSDGWIELMWLLEASDDDLLARVGRWYIAERNPDIVRRTALVVAGNTGDPSDQRLYRCIESFVLSPNPLLRQHALWAARRLGFNDLVVRATSREKDSEILLELAVPVAAR